MRRRCFYAFNENSYAVMQARAWNMDHYFLAALHTVTAAIPDQLYDFPHSSFDVEEKLLKAWDDFYQ